MGLIDDKPLVKFGRQPSRLQAVAARLREALLATGADIKPELDDIADEGDSR